MSDLPRGWIEASGDDLFSSVRGVTYSKSDSSPTPGDGLVPILRANNIVGGGITTDDLVFVPDKYVSPEQNLQDGDLLIASSSGSRTVVGKAATARDDDRIYAFGAFCTVARPRTGDLGRWLAAYSRSRAYRDYVEKVALGISINNLRGSDLKAIPIPVAPLPEQRRIVAKIDSLTGKSRRARDHLDHILRLVEKYKQAILAAAFRGDLTREWREGRNLAATRSVLLGDVAEGFNYGSAAKSAKQGRVPVLRMGNIQDGKLDWSDLVFTDDAAEIAKYGLKDGDVLFNRTNSPALVGKTALFTGEREAIYAGYLIKVRCKPQLLPAFLTYCLNAPNGRAYSWEVKTDGVSQSNINAKKLAAFRFDLPSVQEQEEIVRRIERALSWINRITVDATSARKLIDHLDQSVLAKAFRGELVPQDPADEPASALLDRIRAERTAAPKTKRGRKKAA